MSDTDTRRVRVTCDARPFVMVATAAILNHAITDAAFRLYAILAVHAQLDTRDTTESGVSRANLAEDMGKSRDTVDRALTCLASVGLVSIERERRDDGMWVESTYRLHDASLGVPLVARRGSGGGSRTDAATPSRKNAATGSRTDAATPSRKNAAPKRETNPRERETNTPGPDGPSDPTADVFELFPEPRPSKAVAVPDRFDEFWDAYPRRTAKLAARKAWDKAIRSTDPATIVAGARRYATDPNLPPLTYVPQPSRWLNEGRWADGPLPARDRSAARPTTSDNFAAAQAIAAAFAAEETPR